MAATPFCLSFYRSQGLLLCWLTRGKWPAKAKATSCSRLSSTPRTTRKSRTTTKPKTTKSSTHARTQSLKEHNIIANSLLFGILFVTLHPYSPTTQATESFKNTASKTQNNRSRHDHNISYSCRFGNHVHHRPPPFGCSGGVRHGCPSYLWHSNPDRSVGGVLV